MKISDIKNNINLFVVILFVVLFISVALFFLYQKINNYYEEQARRHAITFVNRIERAIISEGFDLSFYQEKSNRTLLRNTLKELSLKEPRILKVYLIDETRKIIVCTDSTEEDLSYKTKVDAAYLSLIGPKVVRNTDDTALEKLDVTFPVFVGGKFKGHIRAIIGNNNVSQFYRLRFWLLFLFGLLIFIILFLMNYLLSRLSRARYIAAPELDKEEAGESEAENDPAAPEASVGEEVNSDGFNNVFSQFNKLYEDNNELNASFRESEARIHHMMRVLNQGVLILDLTMNIITRNDHLNDVLDIRSTSTAHRKIQQLLNKNPKFKILHEQARDPLTHEVKQRLSLTLLNGRRVNVEILVKAFYQKDQKTVAGVAFYIKNLDVLNKLERTLQRSMKYSVISQLASSIGHEIRNPLSSLAIHTEIVDNMVTKSVEDDNKRTKIKKSIGILNSEVERLQKLIDQFFTLAKAQEIKLTFENISEVMNEVLELVQQQAFEKNVHISTDFSADLPMVKISKDQLKQVIINLVLNGFDAMEDGGELVLGTEFQEGKVVVSVKDSGKGIPENARENIFDLYFTTKDSGGGIGLAISRKIIEAHEGRVYFKTQTNKGTTFFIELPTSQH